MKYGTAELKVPAVFKPQTDTTAATLFSTAFGEHMQTLDIVRAQEQISAVTPRPGSSQMRLGSGKPVTEIHTGCFTQQSAGFDTNSGCKAIWTRKILHLHDTFLLNYHIEIRYGQRYGDRSGVAGRLDSQIVNFDDLALVKAICVPT